MEIITKNAEETKKLGREMASQLGSLTSGQLGSKTAKVIALTGNLGGGKTTFVQGLAEGMGIRQQVISPTFILMRSYKVRSKKEEVKRLYHLDLYRLEENVEEEVKNLGIEEVWKDPKNIVVIEWAEKIKGMVPASATWIKFENLGDERRKIEIQNNDHKVR